MKAPKRCRRMWAVKRETTAKCMDGRTATIHGGLRTLFNTRREARTHIEGVWGYMRGRADLRAYPHGWKMPQAVRVTVTVEETR